MLRTKRGSSASRSIRTSPPTTFSTSTTRFPPRGIVASHNRVSRFTANGDVAQPGSEKVLLEVPGPSSGAHNSGALHFGLDGKLYVAVGDHSTGSNGQSMSTIKGKTPPDQRRWDHPQRQPVLQHGSRPESRDLGVGPAQSLPVRRAAGHGQDPHQRRRQRLMGGDQPGGGRRQLRLEPDRGPHHRPAFPVAALRLSPPSSVPHGYRLRHRWRGLLQPDHRAVSVVLRREILLRRLLRGMDARPRSG